MPFSSASGFGPRGGTACEAAARARARVCAAVGRAATGGASRPVAKMLATATYHRILLPEGAHSAEFRRCIDQVNSSTGGVVSYVVSRNVWGARFGSGVGRLLNGENACGVDRDGLRHRAVADDRVRQQRPAATGPRRDRAADGRSTGRRDPAGHRDFRALGPLRPTDAASGAAAGRADADRAERPGRCAEVRPDSRRPAQPTGAGADHRGPQRRCRSHGGTEGRAAGRAGDRLRPAQRRRQRRLLRQLRPRAGR